jgi:5-methylcytosine-specific restriction endonuclease McrA
MRAKGKHDKLLRRCVPCYEKLLKYESKRVPREGNYKAEAFTNKHVLWNHYVKNSKKRGIDFLLSKTIFQELIVKPCFYCGYVKEGEVNGLDRLDNNKGYTQENLVTSCSTCNLLKGTQHPQEFIDKIAGIHRYITEKKPISAEIINKWQTTYKSKINPAHKTYAKSANSRNIEFSLSEEEFTTILKEPCYLCGITTSETNKNGIDRFNNSLGYRNDNSRPCCGHCNLLKKDIGYDLLIDKAAKISGLYTSLTEYVTTKNILIRSSKTEARIKVECPITEEKIAIEHKPLNEIIVPKEDIPESIKELLKETPHIPKQWKAKQIYQVIQENRAEQYKTYCEEHNMLDETWNDVWNTFVLSVKETLFEQSEPIIRAFVENLRRIRHAGLKYLSV